MKLPAKFQLAILRASGLKIDQKFWRQASKQASKQGPPQTPRVNIKDLKKEQNRQQKKLNLK